MCGELAVEAGEGSRHLSRRVLNAVKLCSAIAAGAVGVLGVIGRLRLTIGTWIS